MKIHLKMLSAKMEAILSRGRWVNHILHGWFISIRENDCPCVIEVTLNYMDKTDQYTNTTKQNKVQLGGHFLHVM